MIAELSDFANNYNFIEPISAAVGGAMGVAHATYHRFRGKKMGATFVGAVTVYAGLATPYTSYIRAMTNGMAGLISYEVGYASTAGMFNAISRARDNNNKKQDQHRRIKENAGLASVLQ